MRFETSVYRLLIGILFAFGAVMAAGVYWAVIGPETALRDPINNYRLRDAAASVIRGEIVDRHYTPLVESIVDTDGFVTRHTTDSSLYSLTGYSSRQYGVGGAEAAYDALLRGDGLSDSFSESLQVELLHLPRHGIDIRLTIDLDVQRAANDALASVGRPGGIAVMDAATGDLLALVSAPSVDPADLDSNWPQLIEDPNTPFLNRATQGQYVAGSALSTVILTAWLIDGRGVDDELFAAGSFSPCDSASPYTVRMAIINACAPAIAEMAARLGTEKIQHADELFGLESPVELQGFTLPQVEPPQGSRPPSTASPGASASALSPLDKITRSPLELAVIVAAIANGGNAMQPVLLSATRLPNDSVWSPVTRPGQLMAVTTDLTASAVANVMRASSANGIAKSEVCRGTDIGALLGLSITQDGLPQAFYTGFATLADGHKVVAALVFEGIDLSRAADIAAAGNGVLCAALASFAEG